MVNLWRKAERKSGRGAEEARKRGRRGVEEGRKSGSGAEEARRAEEEWKRGGRVGAELRRRGGAEEGRKRSDEDGSIEALSQMEKRKNQWDSPIGFLPCENFRVDFGKRTRQNKLFSSRLSCNY